MKFEDIPEIKLTSRKDGTWRARFTFEGKQYERKGRNKREARQRALECCEEIAKNRYKKNNVITFGEFFSEWMEGKRYGKAKDITLLEYERLYRKYIEGSQFDRLRVVNIERRQIVAFYREVGRNKTTYTANRVLLIIGMVLKAAVRDEIIETSPCREIPRLKSDRKPARETIHKALTRAELDAFLEAARNSWYYLLFCFMAATGTRVGEVGALEWGDIDYTNAEYQGGVIHIRTTATKNSEGHLIIGKSTKTKASTRDIPISADIGKIIAEQRVLFEKLHGNVIGIHDRVFQTPNGHIVDNTPVNYEIKRILKKMWEQGKKIHNFRSHAFRDTFATYAVKDGVLINVLKNLLGHKKCQTTFDYYVQEQPESKIEAMNKLQLVKMVKQP